MVVILGLYIKGNIPQLLQIAWALPSQPLIKADVIQFTYKYQVRSLSVVQFVFKFNYTGPTHLNM